MYRLIVESLLGLTRQADRLLLSPQIPAGWDGFRLHYRFRNAEYAITVRAADDDALVVDGKPQQGNAIDLVDDGARHAVELRVARRPGPPAAAEREPTSIQTNS
jgi:cellobiose phosphorylase